MDASETPWKIAPNRTEEHPRPDHRPVLDGQFRLAAAAMLNQVDELERRLASTRALVDGMLDGGNFASALPLHATYTGIPRWHFSMLNDIERNNAFTIAIEKFVPPGSHVLDIGAGSGLLAMLAAQAGAAKVTTCEANPLLAEVARQVVAANGLSDVVTVVAKRSTDLRVGVDLETPVDVVVSEIVDCGLIGEGLLPTVRHARAELLRPGGLLMPRSGRLFVNLLESRIIAGLNRVGTVSGFNMALFNTVATHGHFPVRLSTWPHRLLTGPVELVSFDLYNDALDDEGERIVVFTPTEGEAVGLIAWFELDLGAGVVLHNSPDNLGTHWMQAYVPFESPGPVRADEPVEVTVRWRQGRLTAHLVRSSTNTEVQR